MNENKLLWRWKTSQLKKTCEKSLIANQKPGSQKHGSVQLTRLLMNSSPSSSSSSPISVCLAICVRGVWTNTRPTVTAPLGSDDGGRLVLSVEESTRASLLCAQQRDFWRWWLLLCSRCGARMLHTRKQPLHEMHVRAINVISPIPQISEAFSSPECASRGQCVVGM